MKRKLPIIILGAGGHARVLIDILLLLKAKIIGITDIACDRKGERLMGVPILGEDKCVFDYAPDELFLVNGIGSIENTTPRRRLYEIFRERGYFFTSVIHPRALLSPWVFLEEGVQVLGGAVVNAGTKIGENTIVNTSASVDHDCLLGAHVHIAPGVTLSGGVTVGDGTHIGTGANVIQNISVGSNSFIAAGALVIREVPPGVRVRGVPATVVG